MLQSSTLIVKQNGTSWRDVHRGVTVAAGLDRFIILPPGHGQAAPENETPMRAGPFRHSCAVSPTPTFMTCPRNFSLQSSKIWARQLAVALIYGVMVWLVLRFIAPSGKSSILFLASGFALATILLGGRRYVWGILLGALCVNLLFGYTPITAVAKSLGSTLSALFGAWLLMRDGRFDRTLPTLSDYLRLLLLGGCLASVVSALVGTRTCCSRA